MNLSLGEKSTEIGGSEGILIYSARFTRHWSARHVCACVRCYLSLHHRTLYWILITRERSRSDLAIGKQTNVSEFAAVFQGREREKKKKKSKRERERALHILPILFISSWMRPRTICGSTNKQQRDIVRSGKRFYSRIHTRSRRVESHETSVHPPSSVISSRRKHIIFRIEYISVDKSLSQSFSLSSFFLRDSLRCSSRTKSNKERNFIVRFLKLRNRKIKIFLFIFDCSLFAQK